MVIYIVTLYMAIYIVYMAYILYLWQYNMYIWPYIKMKGNERTWGSWGVIHRAPSLDGPWTPVDIPQVYMYMYIYVYVYSR